MNVRSCCTEYYLLLDTKRLNTLNNIRALLKSVLFDLHAFNFMHVRISLHACSSPCAEFVKPCRRASNMQFLCRCFLSILLIDSESPTLKMDFFEVVFENFVDRFQNSPI